MILLPLSNERKIQEDQYINMLDYLDYMVDVKLPPMEKQNMLLSKYC